MVQNWVQAEKKVKKALEFEFEMSFTKQKLIIGKNSNGEIIKKEFDLVSKDKKNVVEVKSYKLGNETTKKAGYTTTRKWRLIGACFYLRTCQEITCPSRILSSGHL